MNCNDAKNRLVSETNALKQTKALSNLNLLFDDGNFTLLDKFTRSNNSDCEVHTAFGYVSGCPCYAYYQDIEINMGAMGRMQSEKIQKVYDLATKNGMPVISVFDSNGAHIDESIDALNAYGKLISAANSLSGVVPQISVVAGTCIGSAAILASLSDILVVCKNSEFYVNSPVILGDKDGKIGTAKNAVENGSASLIANDVSDAFNKVKEIMSYLPQNNLASPLYADATAPSKISSENTLSKVLSVVDGDSLFEISADYAKDVITAFARVNGNPVGIIACNSENSVISANACLKAARFIRFLDAYSIPVLSFVDCLGFLGSKNDELYGEVKAVSTLTHAYAEATTAKIALVSGYAIGSGFVAFCGGNNADFVYSLPCAKIGTLLPSTAVELFKKDELKKGTDRKTLEQNYEDEECSPFIAAGFGYVNDVFTLENAAGSIAKALDMLSGKRVNTLNKKHSNMPL